MTYLGSPFHEGPQTITEELARHPQTRLNRNLVMGQWSVPSTKRQGGNSYDGIDVLNRLTAGSEAKVGGPNYLKSKKRKKETMGNSFKCCLACILPCGALDVIRIVHLDGQVEEYSSRQVSAGEILAANPDHILSKPCSQGVTTKIVIVSPNSDLKRGHIYFLIPESALQGKERRKKTHQKSGSTAVVQESGQHSCLGQVLSEKKVRHRRRRSGQVGVWRPRLESISED
ncbi:hypothetical protein GW17_00011631 [Ensete ventricosum]|nr:hypothetical protein GW17_00011631 [Ensete ventricosum]